MLNQERAISLLKEKGKRVTPKRIKLLSFFIKSRKAFSLSAIENHFAHTLDRVTIYRILNMYTEIGLLQKMINPHGHFEYACLHEIDSVDCLHPHLKCRECGEIMCLPEFSEEYKVVLNKHHIEEIPMLMDGVCKECLAK